MIIFKPKTYVTDPRESVTISQKPRRSTPVCWEFWEVDRIIMTALGKLYGEGMAKQGPIMKSIIKTLKNDIKKGYVYVDNPKNQNRVDTHIVTEFCERDRLAWSKIINTNDRLNYYVYEPFIDPETGESILTIDLVNCWGHSWGKDPSQNYSDTSE